MSEEETLKTVRKSILSYCQKQMTRSSIKVFSVIIDNDKDNNKGVATGIDAVLALIKKVFNFEIAAYSIQIDDPDNLKPIISLFDCGSGFQVTHNSEEED